MNKIVARIWQGRVPSEKADEYLAYLMEAGIKKIQTTPGNLGVQVMRRVDGSATEFVTISYWPSRETIKAYAGDDIEKPHHLAKDPEYLLEMPERVLHYDVNYLVLPK